MVSLILFIALFDQLDLKDKVGKQIDLREGARRQDRTIALFACLQCWVRGLDGLFFRRNHLLRLLGLKRFKETQVDWLQEDLRELFPHQTVYISNESQSMGGLLASRKELPPGSRTFRQPLQLCRKNNVAVENFELWPRPSVDSSSSALDYLRPFFADSGNSDERLLSAYLVLLSSGQLSPLAVPNIQLAGQS